MIDQLLPEPVETGKNRLITVFGNGMLPLYRHGDRLIVSEHAPLKIGDRVAVCTLNEEMVAGVLIHRDAQAVVIGMAGSSRKDRKIAADDVAFLGRIVWASQ
jgi:phage repressor protein C with HTH and peptisase S24 domain